MCELLGLSSRIATGINRSLAAFAQHRSSSDGWGVAFCDAGDARLYKEPEPAAESTWLDIVRARSLSAPIVLAHIRRATRGVRSLSNTQPFVRELGGRVHVFAHNGRLDSIVRNPGHGRSRFRPIGETDSEIAFCILLDRMAPLWDGGSRPRLRERRAVFERFAAEMRALGPANMLYFDGDTLFVHANRRVQAGGTIAPPGLWRLMRVCDGDPDASGQAAAAAAGQLGQQVMLFASVPLNDESWMPMADGEVLTVRDGRLLGSDSEGEVERDGQVLPSRVVDPTAQVPGGYGDAPSRQ